MSENRKRLDFHIDLSNGQEIIPVKFPNKYRTLLDKTTFKVDNSYIINNFIKNKDINDYLLFSEYGCKCDIVNENNDIKCDENCSCINNHQQKYECNINCECSENCNNRIVQKGLNKKLIVKYISKDKGFGVIALQEIKKDDFVCEYVGEIIDKTSANEKMERNKLRRKNNYVLQIREIYNKIIVNTFIDAEEKGNISRFINHSCDPNLYFDIIRTNYFIPQVAFYAKRDIEIGEEINFSYIENEDKENTVNTWEGIRNSSKKCECNSVNCKKFLPSC